MIKKVVLLVILISVITSSLAYADSFVLGNVFKDSKKVSSAQVQVICGEYTKNAVSGSTGSYSVIFFDKECKTDSDILVKASLDGSFGSSAAVLQDLGPIKLSIIDVFMQAVSPEPKVQSRKTDLRFGSIYLIDEYLNEKTARIVVTVVNEGNKKSKDITIKAGIPEIGFSYATINEIDPKDKASIVIEIEMPDHKGEYDLLISAKKQEP